MRQVIFISCVSKKEKGPLSAEDLYVSPWFKKALKYAKHLRKESKVSTEIFILSAKYGLLSLDERIVFYEQTLNKMNAAEKKEWAKKVISQLAQKKYSVCNTQFTFLAGKNYRKGILSLLCLEEGQVAIPMKGLPIGKQLQFLTNKIRILGLD